MHPDHSVAITGNTVALNRFILEVELKPGPNEPASDEAGPEGFEPPAYGLRVHRSTWLSYGPTAPQ